MSHLIHCNGICLDTVRIICYTPNRIVTDLTAGEFFTLERLMRHPNRIFTREELLSQRSQESECHYQRSVSTVIKRLRRKLFVSKYASKLFIETIYGAGYVIRQRRTPHPFTKHDEHAH